MPMKDTVKLFLLPLLAAACLFLAAPATAQDETGIPPALATWLGGMEGAERGIARPVPGEALAHLFPQHTFFGFYFRQFPIARETPEPFSNTNVLVLSQDGSVTHITSDAQLLTFFKTHTPSADGTTARQMVAAWLLLSAQLLQDGFYTFSEPEGIALENEGPMAATGHVGVTGGGNGKVSARLEFGDYGALVSATTTPEIRSGVRPICQATKLLDADPIVRKMAEQDIIVMGRAAKPYLDEQRAKAAPALQKEIDRLWARIVAGERQ